MPACSTSRIWARSRCGRNPARSRMRRWRWNGWCRRTSLRLRRDGSATPSSPIEAGGILDDLMVANFGDHLFLVVNAACKEEDEAHLRAHLSDACDIDSLADRALIALQGPKAESALAKFCADAAAMQFMDAGPRRVGDFDCFVSRSGYTGEDGFEISVPAEQAEALAAALLDNPDVMPIGLGARDSLRLEAGLCLYGHDIDTTTTPVEGRAGMVGTEEPPQRRRPRRRFPGRGKDPHAVRARRIAPPRRPEGGRPRTGARGRAPVCGCGLTPADRRGHLGRLWPEPQCAGRDGLPAGVAPQMSAPRCSRKCAASDCR